ncbi:alpha-L-rhamnosidase C-terminal domain-containing protein [Catalinimonas sp. 4WD22]|uniref:family 78 glycoside hydrolase catalytic domain n=1 Tax=Catalinimonas locisalis TaxID=3133978 RepID=UPI003100EEE1
MPVSSIYKPFLFLLSISILLTSTAHAQDKLLAPQGLLTDLLEHSNRTYTQGYQTNMTLQQVQQYGRDYQHVTIQHQKPVFSWIVNDDKQDVLQTAYQLQLATDEEKLRANDPDLWNSGKVSSSNSSAVVYEGTPLKANTIYYWRVKVWNNQQEESPYSAIASFRTGAELLPHDTPRYPTQKTDERPVSIHKIEGEDYFIDFGKDAFAQLSLTLHSAQEDTLTIHFGESVTDAGRIDREPGGTIRYQAYQLPINEGTRTYKIAFRPDERNTGDRAIKIPDYIGEVLPFRYCEIEGYAGEISTDDVVRHAVHYPFNEEASYFQSADTVLNAVWELSKYSIKATSFAGIYVDGDRERIPYEADALINQLCHYAVDREYSMGRYSHEYLITHATWPTEWILQSVLMAWNDYLYTGNLSSAEHYYDDLKSKTLTALAGDDHLISTQRGQMDQEVLASVHYEGEALRDIVDWPHTGILGLGKEEAGETDGYVFTEVNTVVNAYHYQALVCMSRIAADLGKTADSREFMERAEAVKKSFNQRLLDKQKGYYVDGMGTEHSSLHANMFPLAFGLVPEKYRDSVIEFVRSRGMACSVYGSQFLMDAVYEAEAGAYGLELLSSTAERSWYNMIRAGATITMEAWDNKYKPNQDWNHAWGAAPANIIPRKLMGIEPLEPGFARLRIKPQPGTLEWAEVRMPTIRGAVEVSFDQRKGFTMEVDIPANTEAEVYMPLQGKKINTAMVNGSSRKGRREGNFLVFELGSGKYSLNY